MKEIALNAFTSHSLVHLSPGMWGHPRDKSTEYTRLEHWQKLASLLEAGKFDAMFLADTIGLPNLSDEEISFGIKYGIRIPRHDPTLLVPAMAACTEHLGFGVTGTLTYEAPYVFARRMSTLDHLTNGRVGWNVVTGHLSRGAKAVGTTIKGHDQRYDVADEYMDVVYALWEGSWEDGAVVKDRANGQYANPDKVHEIRHDGEYFRMRGVHMVEPSLQRTPVLYQAGASDRGRDFAAQHAECVFVHGRTPAHLKEVISDTRRRAVAFGRAPGDVKFFALATVIVGENESAAHEKLAGYRGHVNLHASLLSLSSFTGIDLTKYSLDAPFPNLKGDAGVHSLVESLSDRHEALTIRKAAELSAIGSSGPLIVGSPMTVADQLQDWVDISDCDGFNLSYAVMPGDFEDFVTLVVPELQNRGIYKTGYREGTLRQKLTGSDSGLLPISHPAARHRRDPGLSPKV